MNAKATVSGARRLHEALEGHVDGAPALLPFLTAGYPSREAFVDLLEAVGEEADAIEIGIPFSDPMADGVTIQRSSQVALEDGTTLAWVLSCLAASGVGRRLPVLLMSYVNPLLSYGPTRLAQDAAEAGVAGIIVPDLPFEECAALRDALHGCGVGLVQLVSPVTPKERLRRLCEESDGFVYAVTMTGTTGGSVGFGSEALDYLDTVRSVSRVPVCAGFGIRSAEQVDALAGRVDGVIVGSALIEAVDAGLDVRSTLRSLRRSTPTNSQEARS